jgi:aspartate racemase
MKYKILGLIGGIGPESTMDYYKTIIQNFRQKVKTNDYPHFLVNNINMIEMLSYVAGDLNELVNFLAKEIKKLEDAGADFVAMASNTPHIVFDDLEKKVALPMISIVKVTMEAARKQGLKKIALFGTKSTMEGGFYQKTGVDYSIEVLTPDKSSMEFINEKYFGELVAGIIREETKKELISIAKRIKDEEGIEGLILGGTELPLILSQDDFNDIALLNTSQIHVNSLIDMMFS